MWTDQSIRDCKNYRLCVVTNRSRSMYPVGLRRSWKRQAYNHIAGKPKLVFLFIKIKTTLSPYIQIDNFELPMIL